jgi:DNA-directed RNA polymerase subunit N (RpoN/RPB10)|uniref:DNA-directed RNA polymerase subunit N n=1 Tax=viral metagenome TaxID=1070528 RepID=A0A6C0J2J6_9ZZZZ
MIIPVRCFTCGRVMADVSDYYEKEKEKLILEDKKVTDSLYKNFDNIHTKEILDNLGLRRYCCRRNLISNIDMMHII